MCFITIETGKPAAMATDYCNKSGGIVLLLFMCIIKRMIK